MGGEQVGKEEEEREVFQWNIPRRINGDTALGMISLHLTPIISIVTSNPLESPLSRIYAQVRTWRPHL